VVKITATGGQAQAFCDSDIKANSSDYAVDQPGTAGTLMCRYTVKDGTQLTVRDKGIFKLEGNAVCDARLRPRPESRA
jgi:hypothetical protein